MYEVYKFLIINFESYLLTEILKTLYIMYTAFIKQLQYELHNYRFTIVNINLIKGV